LATHNFPVVLGVDPGSHITGFGVITQEGTRLIHVRSGSITAPGASPLQMRLSFIHNGLVEVIQETRPSVLAIESVFYGKNVRSTVSLAHARGVALLAAAQFELPVVEYSPMEVKKAVIGFGRASKDQVAEMMRRLFRAPTLPESGVDTTDALAIALCHLNIAATTRRIVPQGVS
jgi:crossover junction endodeoxyribonuclease RuvC